MNKNGKPTRRGRKWLFGAGAGILVLLGVTYVVAYFVAGNQLPSRAAVDGVPIGGLSAVQAEEKLQEELEPIYAKTIKLEAEDVGVLELEPLDSGLKLDFERAVQQAGGGFSWNPVRIYNAFRGGGDMPMPKSLDRGQLTKILEAEAEEFSSEPEDATLFYEDAKVSRTNAVNGTELDVAGTVDRIGDAIDEHKTEIEPALTESEPEVTDSMVDDAIKEYAAPAVSGPITIKVGDKSFEITPEQIAEVTELSFKEGEFKHATDEDKLMEVTKEARSALETKNTRNATYEMKDGKIVVVPSVDGETIKAEELAEALEEAAVKEGDERVASVETVKEKADFNTEEAEKVAPKEVIGEFSTSYPHAAYRNTNIGKAASTVNGTVVMPDEIFSLNDTLGERTAANGYVDGYVISGGVLVKASGGGISQSATTLYNAGFFAGMEDIEHKPHTLYFDRYPAGREATVYYGSLDMRFRNNTKYPIYIQGYISPSSPGNQGSVTFKIWSIPTWDKIESTTPQKSGFYSGGTRTLKSADCEPQAPIQGFTVTWSRLFYKDGSVAKRENYSWKYNAGDRIVCE